MHIKKNVYPLFIFYLPIIVFDGPMYNGKLTEDKISLEERNHVILEYQYQPKYTKHPQRFLIDIVKKEYFPEFIEIIKEDISKINKSIEANTKKILEITKSLNLELR